MKTIGMVAVAAFRQRCDGAAARIEFNQRERVEFIDSLELIICAGFM